MPATATTTTAPSHKQPVSLSSSSRRKTSGTGLNDVFIGMFGVAFLVSLSLNVLHWSGSLPHDLETTPVHAVLQDFAAKKSKQQQQVAATKQPIAAAVTTTVAQSDVEHPDEVPREVHLEGKTTTTTTQQQQQPDPPPPLPPQQQQQPKSTSNLPPPTLAILNCSAHGGPYTLAETSELVYWQDIPSDAQWTSPVSSSSSSPGYLTFEPDGGGWNNIRMAMETVLALGVAMGRTIVMPPSKKLYLLQKGRDKKHFSFVDFFPIYDIAQEHVGMKVMSMQEYLEQEAMAGNLKNATGHVEFPPNNRTDWEGIEQKDYDELRYYLRRVSKTARWTPGDCLPAFPQSGNHNDVQLLEDLIPKARKQLPDNNPVDVDSENVLARLEETLAGRKKLCVYDESLQREHVVHFQMNHKEHLRLLVHFYAFLFFEDWKEDLWMKRFIRDHVRYIDPIQCAAARLVSKVRQHVRQRDPSNVDGIFDSMHVRRGDFQFKSTRISAEEIYRNTKNELTPNSTIFIATDERDKKFFDPLREHYDLLFLDDFLDDLKDVNTNYYGMIDQLVSSKGRIFFGCWFSTFTGYITRIRGYHSQHKREPGYLEGILPTTFYYATIDRKQTLLQYSALRGGFFNREFPTSWHQIDKSVGQMTTTSTT